MGRMRRGACAASAFERESQQFKESIAHKGPVPATVVAAQPEVARGRERKSHETN